MAKKLSKKAIATAVATGLALGSIPGTQAKANETPKNVLGPVASGAVELDNVELGNVANGAKENK